MKIKIRELKTEFIAIQEEAIGKPMTMVLMQELQYKFQELFDYFLLRDLQWRLTKGEDTIVFTPIRVIDQYAINGILAL